jgi:predicted transglutaminase-like cysteine proteinase
MAGMLAGSAPALAEPAAVTATPIPMRVYGPAQPPYGFVSFCQRAPRECLQGPLEENRFSLTSRRRTELETVNSGVNHQIKPVTDLDLYGVADYWTIPRRQGDCEDYVLLKRKELMELGWPASALLITVVRDERGDGHAVLTARTQQGDFVLDNKTDEIRFWYQVPYQFIMRQSYLNPRVWLSLDPKERNQSMPLAGVKSAP